jgi:anti-sigma factor RsiW
MTSDGCRDVRGALGAAALGRLDAYEDLALRAHLDGCAECRAELRELSAVARALPLADVTRVTEGASEPSRELGQRVVDRIDRERLHARRHVRRRALAGVAVALAVAAALVGAFLFVPSGGSPGKQIAFPANGGVAAHATLHAKPAGTQVQFHVRGLHDGDYYWLWLTAEDGDRVAAGTFRGNPGGVDVTMTAAIPLDDTRRVWVTDADNHVVVDRWIDATN